MVDFNIYINILLNVTIFTKIRNTCKEEKYHFVHKYAYYEMISFQYLFNESKAQD